MGWNIRSVAVYLLVVLNAGLAATAAAEIKCWTNKDGVRECGNVVPPEYSQQEQTELSDTGVTTGRIERARTPEELEQERQVAAAKADEEHKRREQAAADRELLQTYSSEDEIILARDGKIADIESRIKLTESHIEKLTKNLTDIIDHAAAMERRGEQPGAKTVSDIESVRAQIRYQAAFIAAKHADQDVVRRQYDAELARYREMKSNVAAPDATAAGAH
ncbi:MAG: hypothetical protein ACT4NU_03930 [Chromatiales bacterium]